MKKAVSDFSLPVFLRGENIDLCIPTLEYARDSSWYSWFNDPKTTRFLEQGIFPNTSEKQQAFFQSLENHNRLSFIISDRHEYIGTISFSNLNMVKKTAEIAMLIGERSSRPNNDLFALESMALLTSHGLNNMGIDRISAGQHIKLFKWQQKLELIGYRLEGVWQMGFNKGLEKSDSVFIAITKREFDMIILKRKSLWDSSENMRSRISRLPERSFVSQLRNFFNETGEDYYSQIFEL